MIILFLILSLIGIVASQFCEKDAISCNANPIVETNLGTFVGNQEDLVGIKINVFKGIPFARPPIGQLRFLDPVPITDLWTDHRHATEYGNKCPQLKCPDCNEDCLYLNIWSPSVKKATPRPVMVFIHGGSFNMGSGSDKSGAALAGYGDVIVVSFNYRLGFLGYFYSDLTGSSNMGMKDQTMALKWVHDNIHHFGGDPDQVTLFGHSAGGISVGMHLLSPQSAPYFERAIMESGSPYSFLRPDSIAVASEKTLNLSKFLNCSSDLDSALTADAVNCLRSADVQDILVYGSVNPMHSIILPNPLYGDDFYPDRANVANIGNVSKKDLIIGVESTEGELFVRRRLGLMDKDEEIKCTMDKIAEWNKILYNGKLSDSEREELLGHYFDQSDTREQLEAKLFQAYGDLYVYCPTNFFAKHYGRGHGHRTFVYALNYKVSIPETSYCNGVCHGEELPLVFGLPILRPKSYEAEDRYMSLKVMEYWSSFAKGHGLNGWSSMESGGDNGYNIIDGNAIRIENFGLFEHCDNFWKNIFHQRLIH